MGAGRCATWTFLLCGVLLLGCGADDDEDSPTPSEAGDDDSAVGDDDSTGDDDSVGDDDSGGDDDTSSPTPEPTPQPYLEEVCGWDEMEAVTEPGDDWWQDRVFMEIYLRSFQDSDGDGIGDLQGLISRLDYLNDGNTWTDDDLGVTGIWLMPIFESPSENGYDVSDFRAIDPDYGSMEDLETLLEEAHTRGIEVLLDLPFNSSSIEHEWFQDAASDAASSHRDYYVWSESSSDSDWLESNGAYYYAHGGADMPDLNYYSADLQEEMRQVYDFWMEKGVDGFRLDAVPYLVEEGLELTENSSATHCYLQGLRRYFDNQWPGKMLIGEVWALAAEIAPYLGDGQNELPLAFDYPLADSLITAIQEQDPAKLQSALEVRISAYPESDMVAPFLRNQDQDRSGSVLEDLARRKLAAAIYLSLPGPPSIYYGEEIGMTGERGEASDSNPRRTPMQWSAETGAGFTEGEPWYPINEDYSTVNVAAQSSDSSSLLSWYRELIRLRLDSEALLRGEHRALNVYPAGPIAYLRGSGDGAILVVTNLGEESLSNLKIDVSGFGDWDSGEDLLSGSTFEGPFTPFVDVDELPAFGVMWIKLESDSGTGDPWD